ncbi:MAG TPA: DUF3761 domain-containing protein [Noviherbaspirillum sp.]
MLKKILINQICKTPLRGKFNKMERQVKKLLVALFIFSSVASADDKVAPPPTSAAVQASDSQLLSNKHYVNSNGQIVHSPSKTESGRAPVGATARYADGSHSSSQHHQGTCFHHCGVAT